MEAQTIVRANVPIRLLVVTDHVILRQGIRVMLKEEDGFEIISTAEDERDVLSLNRGLKPDIVLIDLGLEVGNGLAIAQQLLRSSPDTSIVLFAGPHNKNLVLEAMRIGVRGYLQKTLSIEDLRTALRTVKGGECFIGDPMAVTHVVREFRELSKEQNRMKRGLSTMEIDLIRLASKGYTNKEIGQQHYWSEVQVKRKMQEIYKKLQVSDRAHAVAEAMRQGLI